MAAQSWRVPGGGEWGGGGGHGTPLGRPSRRTAARECGLPEGKMLM